MTEDEWRTCADLGRMLDFAVDRASERKIRLFGCACCRSLWPLLVDARSRLTVRQAERFADGLIEPHDLDRAADAARQASAELSARCTPGSPTLDRDRLRFAAAEMAHEIATRLWYNIYDFAAESGVLAGGPDLLRCNLGNPFRPAAFAPAWRTTDVRLLARGIYQDRAFDRMPILADALQDAGCDDVDILNHCRDTDTPHARGCWAVDLVLDKS